MSKWTIEQAISSYFPEGTVKRAGQDTLSARDGLIYYPSWPPDLFAAMAFLIEKSGAYAFWDPINPELLVRSAEACEMGQKWRQRPVDPEEGQKYDDWRSIAARNGAAATEEVDTGAYALHQYLQSRWELLTKGVGSALWSQPLKDGKLQDWCYTALELLIVADEASAGIGEAHFSERDESGNLVPSLSPSITWAPAFFEDEIARGDNRFLSVETRSMIWESTTKPIIGLFDTVTLMFDRSVACVLPKMRTPQVGATLRAFSHHLAMVPGSQEVRNVWFQSPTAYSDERVFNLLVLPFPYIIPTGSFVAKKPDGRLGGRWGSFQLKPLWLGEFSDANDFAGAVMAALDDAKNAVDGDVHGVVLPESALTPEYYDALITAMQADAGCDVELLIAGVAGESDEFKNVAKRSAADVTRDVNVVALARFRTPELDDRGIRLPREVDIFYQPKHHRWRLDRGQLKTYGLAAKLGGADYRWEDISTDFRNVHFLPMRTHGAIVGLVCEDLARIDPCQTVLRAVGPNLVVALLMDGPQIPSRWSSRYATVLADDPGSSVLTVTSAGLVTRSYELGGKPESHVVALWRDGSGDIRPLPLQPGAAGFVLSLEARPLEERTMDDRSDHWAATRYELVQVVDVFSTRLTYAPPPSPATTGSP